MSNPSEDYLSFEKALRELNLKSEELKKLVSEGEIRAFREGSSSMKFRREDVDALRTRRTGEEELVFADALEDDATGMVTEDLSAEETLLVEDEVVEVAAAPRRGAAAPARTSARARIEVEETEHEPGWVTAAALIGTFVMLYGMFAVYHVVFDLGPTGPLGVFAK